MMQVRLKTLDRDLKTLEFGLAAVAYDGGGHFIVDDPIDQGEKRKA